MLMKFLPLILMAAAAAPCLSASAQGGYHYGYGGSRVVNQGQTGLYNPSGTYIGGGTMSQSARGLPAGVSSGAMGGLPQTKMGANVGTPGDNQYTDAVQIQRHMGQQVNMPIQRRQINYGQQQQQSQNMHYYVPGQNGGAIKQGQFVSPGQRYNTNGAAATYAETDQYNVNSSGTFHY